MCCTAFFGFFRLGELLQSLQAHFNPELHLSWGDMAVDNPQNPKMLKLRLRQSKTDQFGRGVDVVLGKTGCEICPVSAVLSYVSVRGGQQGPFFLKSTKRPLLKQDFITEIRGVLTVIGFPKDQYAGHSFRIGAATSAALAGVEDSTIQIMGRWQSAAFLRYVRTPLERLAAIAATIAAQGRARPAESAQTR